MLWEMCEQWDCGIGVGEVPPTRPDWPAPPLPILNRVWAGESEVTGWLPT